MCAKVTVMVSNIPVGYILYIYYMESKVLWLLLKVCIRGTFFSCYSINEYIQTYFTDKYIKHPC